MPPKKDKNPEDKPGKKDDKKNKKKLANKRLGMGGTIGLSEKPVKKCIMPCEVKSFTRPVCCPQQISCQRPPICCPLTPSCPPPSCCPQTNYF